jgi:SAM-dependent methyltransferase
MSISNKLHWEKIYETKTPDQVSWTQEIPEISLEFIHSIGLSKNASIIDIGGGDSIFVDHLLDMGFINITILDISSTAIERAKKRLGSRAEKINWIVSDINEYIPHSNFDLWHDRAAFHFLTNELEIKKYLDTVNKYVNGYLILGTFSENGPQKCSGLDIKNYSTDQLSKCFIEAFTTIQCKNHDHVTPFGTTQNFSFCCFKHID